MIMLIYWYSVIYSRVLFYYSRVWDTNLFGRLENWVCKSEEMNNRGKLQEVKTEGVKINCFNM